MTILPPFDFSTNGLTAIRHLLIVQMKERLGQSKMATPGELVHCVAECFALPVQSVVQIDRMLAESGLRRSGGRGKSAAKMGAADAAALLIAASVPCLLRSVPDITRTFWNLPFKGADSRKQLLGLPFPAMKALDENHLFGDGLAALIEAAASGQFETYAKEAVEQTGNPRAASFFTLEVAFFIPGNSAQINFFDQSHATYLNYNNVPTDSDAIRKWAEDFNSDPKNGDLSNACRFTSRTIRAVSNLIKAG